MEEVSNKLDYIVKLAQEKIKLLLNDFSNEQIKQKAKKVFSGIPVVLENIDVQKNEFNKEFLSGGYTTPQKIFINYDSIKKVDLNEEMELDNTLGIIIHEYAHRLRQIDFKYGNMFEEASASIFAEMCINYSKLKTNDNKNNLFNMRSSIEYEKAESQVRGILYILKQKNIDISMMVEYIAGDENKFKQVCSEIFGTDFENYFNHANNTSTEEQHNNQTEQLITNILTNYIKNNQVSFKDYWSNKTYVTSANLYFSGSPTLCQSVVNAGRDSILDDEKDLYNSFEYTSKVNQEEKQFIDEANKARINNVINKEYDLTNKTKEEINDTLIDICSSYIQHKSLNDEDSKIYMTEIQKIIPNIEEFVDIYKELRISRLDDKILDNIDITNINYNVILSNMRTLLLEQLKEEREELSKSQTINM